MIYRTAPEDASEAKSPVGGIHSVQIPGESGQPSKPLIP